jgi:DNA-directed RNA polymerase subunit RPC12/RpoP
VKPALTGRFYILDLDELSMLVGKCTRCDKRYIGWALSRPEHQMCPNCGTRLLVYSMDERYQPDAQTTLSVQKDKIGEWQEALESMLHNFLL